MFTGLVQGVGQILSKHVNRTQSKLRIETRLTESLRLGDSVAVNGVCLTVSRLGIGWFEADVMPCTLENTNLKYLALRDPVNLEPAVRMGEPLGGHLVSGHVDGVGKISEIRPEQNAVLMKVSVAKELMAYMTVKGSIALDGVSLTIQETAETGVYVSIIPHTFGQTRFKWLRPGDLLNIEADLMIKHVLENQPVVPKKDISLEFLKNHGYLR